MSDGPWKSLPLPPHWKRVAEQAENGSFSPDEVSRAMDAALSKDARELPLERVRRALSSGVLFGLGPDEKFESIRQDYPGSKLLQALLIWGS